MASRKTLLADLAGITIPRHPFQSRERAFTAALGGYTLTAQDIKILKVAIGSVADIYVLKAFLRVRCSVTTESEFDLLSWPRIMSMLQLSQASHIDAG